MAYTKAVRKAAPALIAVSSVSGAGKTYSALLLASGLAGPKGRVGFLDTENGRGTMYADVPGIMKALPDGYEIEDLNAPFSPERYSKSIVDAEQAGINVLIVDSVTHEWEGIGGCVEIAEKFKIRNRPNWAKAKIEHKRFMYNLLAANMDIILCVRGREKVKIQKNAKGEEEYIPLGVMPVTEKNLIFEMLLSFHIDHETHFASALKCPEQFKRIFSEPKLLTKEHGEMIREWKMSGAVIDPMEQVKKRARAAAEDGLAVYEEFFKSITKDQRKTLDGPFHEEMKALAITADKEAMEAEENPGMSEEEAAA